MAGCGLDVPDLQADFFRGIVDQRRVKPLRSHRLVQKVGGERARQRPGDQRRVQPAMGNAAFEFCK
jgi:hypothetical protein